MKKLDVQKLSNGIYILFWKKGGLSLASVGTTKDGGKWMAPINWVSPTSDQKHWAMVDVAEPVDVNWPSEENR